MTQADIENFVDEDEYISVDDVSYIAVKEDFYSYSDTEFLLSFYYRSKLMFQHRFQYAGAQLQEWSESSQAYYDCSSLNKWLLNKIVCLYLDTL